MKKTPIPLVKSFMEKREAKVENINKIPKHTKKGGQGVYVLYDGSMPVYVGKENMRVRIRKAKRRDKRWDHFSCYAIDSAFQHDAESLLLRALPWYVRALNQQGGKFVVEQMRKKKRKSMRSSRK